MIGDDDGAVAGILHGQRLVLTRPVIDRKRSCGRWPRPVDGVEDLGRRFELPKTLGWMHQTIVRSDAGSDRNQMVTIVLGKPRSDGGLEYTEVSLRDTTTSISVPIRPEDREATIKISKAREAAPNRFVRHTITSWLIDVVPSGEITFHRKSMKVRTSPPDAVPPTADVRSWIAERKQWSADKCRCGTVRVLFPRRRY